MKVRRWPISIAMGLGLATLVVPPAAAETQLICNRLSGAYSIYPDDVSNTYHWVRAYQAPQATWTEWLNPQEIKLRGFPLPNMGQVAVYLYYARWNGLDWEYAGEWGYVTNARGERVGYYC